MEKSKIDELELKLAELQKELDGIKGGGETAEKKEPDLWEVYKDRHDALRKELADLQKEMTENGVQAVSTVVTVTRFRGLSDTNCHSGRITLTTVDDISEDGLAAALDVFTNPRRIAVLKLLTPRFMTAAEISRETGLIGGQLYHHLSCLENAGLIRKEADRYRTLGSAQSLLCGLSAAVGGMDIAKKK